MELSQLLKVAAGAKDTGKRLVFDMWRDTAKYLSAEPLTGKSGRTYQHTPNMGDSASPGDWMYRWADWSNDHGIGFVITHVEKDNWRALRVSFIDRELNRLNSYLIESPRQSQELRFYPLRWGDQLVVVAIVDETLLISRYDMLNNGAQLSAAELSEAVFSGGIDNFLYRAMPRYITDDGCIVMPYKRSSGSTHYSMLAKVSVAACTVQTAQLYYSSNSGYAEIHGAVASIDGSTAIAWTRNGGKKKVDWEAGTVTAGTGMQGYLDRYSTGQTNAWRDPVNGNLIVSANNLSRYYSSDYTDVPYLITVLAPDLTLIDQYGVLKYENAAGDRWDHWIGSIGLICRFDQLLAYDYGYSAIQSSTPPCYRWDGEGFAAVGSSIKSPNGEHGFSCVQNNASGYRYLKSLNFGSEPVPWGLLNQTSVHCDVWWRSCCVTDDGRLLMPVVRPGSDELYCLSQYADEIDFGPEPQKVRVTLIGGGGSDQAVAGHYAGMSWFGRRGAGGGSSSNGYLPAGVAAHGQGVNGYQGYGNSQSGYSGHVDVFETTVSGRVGIRPGHGYRQTSESGTDRSAHWGPRKAADGAVIVEWME